MDLIDSREIWISAFQELDQYNKYYWSNIIDYAEIIFSDRPEWIDEIQLLSREIQLFCWEGKRNKDGVPLIPSIVDISEMVQTKPIHAKFRVRIDEYRDVRTNRQILGKLDNIKKYIIRRIAQMNIRYKNPKMKLFG